MATTTCTAPHTTTTSAARSSACGHKTMWLIVPVSLILLWSENTAHSFSLLEPSSALIAPSFSKKHGLSAPPRPIAASIRISDNNRRPRGSHYCLQAQTDDNDDNDRDNNSGNDDIGSSAEPEMVQASEVRMDDGGSNLTDRFKYKVNALMGVFDPADAANDNEWENGNLLNAMLNFPLEYTFHVVGKTGGDRDAQEEFVGQVKEIAKTTTASSSAPGGDDGDEVICRITPRGSKFTKVTIQVQVDSADVIASIYDQLEALELSVMQF